MFASKKLYHQALQVESCKAKVLCINPEVSCEKRKYLDVSSCKESAMQILLKEGEKRGLARKTRVGR